MAVDPNSTATTTTTIAPSSSAATTTATTVTPTTATAATRPFTSPPQSSRPVSPLQHHLHNIHHYPSQPLFTAQPLPIRAPNTHSNSQLSKPHDPSQGILYPIASSGCGFIPNGIRPLPTDHMVTVANYGAYPHHSLVFPHGLRAVGSPHLEYLNHPLHMTRPPNLQYHHIGSAGGPGSGPIKGVPVSSHAKAAPRSKVSDSNGYKNTRERSREDTLSVVRDRKVRITEDASLYALCRSWLRNGVYEESQPQQTDVITTLPKPVPATMVASFISNKKEDEEEQEEDEKSVEHLSSQDLLSRHIKRAKKVRARLREERLQRITRYRSRLRLLLPPPIEQFRNDTPAGN